MDMVMRRLLTRALLILAALLPAPALAVDLVGGMNTLTLECKAATPCSTSGWQWDGTKLIATDVWAKRAYKTTASVVKGGDYLVDINVSGYATGSLSPYVTGVKMGSTGSYYVAPCGLQGECPIADNFNPADGLMADVLYPAEVHLGDSNGSFRFSNPGKVVYLPDDPIVLPGLPGASHLHQFLCNTGVNANSTYKSLRTTGGSSCSDPKHPVNRSSYWTPAMLDGYGGIVPVDEWLIYYKTIDLAAPECNPATGVDWHAGNYVAKKCIVLPNGLRWVNGYNFATGLEGPTDPVGGGGYKWSCQDTMGVVTAGFAPYYNSITEVRNAGCPVGKYLYFTMTGPSCWDGVNLDSPDHRSHVSNAGGAITLSTIVDGSGNHLSWSQCDAAHPYMIPSYSVQGTYRITSTFAHWHLSSDEQMTMAMDDGATLHMDYFEGWSPTIKTTWHNCFGAENPTGVRYSANSGQLCDGTQMIGATGGGTTDTTVTPRTRVGWGDPPIKGNGHFVYELHAASSGELGLYGYGGFTGNVTSFTVTDKATTGKRTGITVTGP
jgi:hypothetical protein